MELNLHGSISSVEAKMVLRSWVNSNVEPTIVQLDKEHGHRVIFTPPHYSDLQPIELLWARIKGAVSRQYTKSTTLEDVSNRLNHQFQLLDSEEGKDGIYSII